MVRVRYSIRVTITGPVPTRDVRQGSALDWVTLGSPTVTLYRELPAMPTDISPTLPLDSYRSYLMGLARVLLAGAGPVRAKVDASDLVQSVMLRAHQREKQFKGTTPEEFMAWLRQILRNELIDKERHFLRKKRDAALEAVYQETIENSDVRMIRMRVLAQTSPSQHLARHERQMHLVRALETLPEDQRTAVELRHLADWSPEEIAQFTNRTKASVAGLLRRGLKALCQELERSDSPDTQKQTG